MINDRRFNPVLIVPLADCDGLALTLIQHCRALR
jgi:hypothetical protein